MLWLWRRPAAAAPIRPLVGEPPYAAGAALKRQKIKKKVSLVILLIDFGVRERRWGGGMQMKLR